MSRSSSRGSLLAIVLAAVVIGAPLLSGMALPVRSAAANSSYAVAQGTTCTVVSPIDGVDENVSTFYDYRNPHTSPSAPTYSSYGTTEFQVSRGSVLMFYEGPEGTSMILLHEKLGDETGGSTATFRFSGLPGGEWAVKDDVYVDEDGEQDDDWETDGSEAEVDWKWGDNRTDGGAYRGIDETDGAIVIDARFNEEADHWGDWTFSGSDDHRITSWTLTNGDGTQTRSLELDRRVFVHSGGCKETPPSTELDGPDTTQAETNATFDAGGTTDDGTIGGYEWDFDGDGTVDEVTVDATATHTYGSGGTYEVSVTAFDTYGNGDTASMIVEVEQPDTPPNASLTAPDFGTVNESVTLNASGSTDEGTITGYEWDLDADGTFEHSTDVPTFDHTYSQTGNYTATVRVTDDSNQTATASTTIEVREPNQPPSAAISAPESTVQGNSLTLDASASTDDRDIVTYRWDLDGDGTVDFESSNATVEHAYQETGTVSPTVTVVDSDGLTDTASTTVEVNVPETPPSANLTAPEVVALNETFTLDASGSSDEGTIVEYRWDLDGDGTADTTTTGPTIEHAYSSTGTVSPSVTVVDDNGSSTTASVTLTVEENNVPPSASISAPETVLVNESVVLDASGSSDDGAISAYNWDFEGDGTVDETTTEPTVNHSYTTTGTVEPTVLVVDSSNETGSASTSINVTEPVDLQPEIVVSPTSATAGDRVSFDATGSQPADRIDEYQWSFGDGATGTGATTSHSYESEGDYTVELRVTTDAGQTATTTTTVSIAAANSGGGGGGGGAGGGGGGGGGGGAGGSGESGTPRSTDKSDDATGSGQANELQPNISDVTVSTETRTLVEGETFVVDATVRNTGNETGTKNIEFEVDGTVVEEREFSVEPNETRTLTFTYRFTSPGNKSIRIDSGEPFTVRVVPAVADVQVTALRADPGTVSPGEEISFSATVSNVGHAEGSKMVALELFGETVAVQEVALAPGESTTVTFTRTIGASGTYEAVVGNESATVTVEGQDEPTTSTRNAESRASTPGFGLFAALTALILVVIIGGRRAK